MFKRLNEKLTQFVNEKLRGLNNKPPFNPAIFNDPVAMKTEWTPAHRGGTNFKTHKLVKIHAQRMEFRSTAGMILFGGIFFVIGIGVTIGFILYVAYTLNEPSSSFEPALLLLLLFGGVFGGVGGFLLRSALIPAVFDLSHGYYCKSRKKPEMTMHPSRIKGYVKLNQIHAIQTLAEYCSGDKSSYYSYELNLVLKDGSRINVIDHGKSSDLNHDAQTIADLLSVPLWRKS